MGVRGLTSLLSASGALPAAPPLHPCPPHGSPQSKRGRSEDNGDDPLAALLQPSYGDALPESSKVGDLHNNDEEVVVEVDDDEEEEVVVEVDDDEEDDDRRRLAVTIPPYSTLAVDGDGLAFHLIRLAYRVHLRRLSCNGTRPQSPEFLPSFLPLRTIHAVTFAYINGLVRRKMDIKIYFDGPHRPMKGAERKRRTKRRGQEWDNLRSYCKNGALPKGFGSSGASRFRSSSGRGLARVNMTSDSSCDADADAYLGSFPLSALALRQVRSSLYDAARSHAPGVVVVVRCAGEADPSVARSAADDITGETYALGSDSDYLIYGECCALAGTGDDCCLEEVKYVPLEHLNFSPAGGLQGMVLRRSDVAEALGLSQPTHLVDLACLLGNDYTGHFLWSEDDDFRRRRMFYRDSLRWIKSDGAGDAAIEMPPDLDWSDRACLTAHVAEMAGEEYKLVSVEKDLQAAIEFSSRLYCFQDVSMFYNQAQTTNEVHKGEGGAKTFHFCGAPSLPPGLDLGLTDSLGGSGEVSVGDAALLPVTVYMSQLAGRDSQIEQPHVHAFREMLQTCSTSHVRAPFLKRRLQWNDIQALYIFEMCLLAALKHNSVMEGGIYMPHVFFDHLTFISALERLTAEDPLLDNDIVPDFSGASLTEGIQNAPSKGSRDHLPIDDYEGLILETIQKQRVTIIHGEVGCGKSSRVPCMLLRSPPPEPTARAREVKIVITQPRRIAAKSLVERVRSCEHDLRHKVALRMGHGVREHEEASTRAWFVTTGYCVRLLANHPEWFDSHTHLIIDEVHERSVDTDILCLLCRRLLSSHPTIRLVLMSATLAAQLYSSYFRTPEPPIHVGSRRYPIKELFVEDLYDLLHLSSKDLKIANDVFDQCEKSRCSITPSNPMMDKLYHLATQITLSVGSHGSSVLIFVPGMNDIEAISERIEALNCPGVAFSCLPIHSDVPFEEQMAAFEPAKEGEVKVVIATNAAESSVTLPDVDHVICLGLCKQIVYNEATHRQILQPCWISKASSTQRAGRTGRVRKGNVYRLYSRNTYECYMDPFEAGEMLRIPLDSVILSLRDMLNEAVTPVLLDCLEPPNISNIRRSFDSLYASKFISSPSDEGAITTLGSLVVRLGIDLSLGALVGLSIELGLCAEGIQLAAILSFPKTPWAISNPIYHETEQYNEISSSTFSSKAHFDAGLYSEPLGVMNLLWDYETTTDKKDFCWKQSVSHSRLRHLASTVESLRRRVGECLKAPRDSLKLESPPYLMSNAKTQILRIIQVWNFNETMIVQSPKQELQSSIDSFQVQITGPFIGRNHLLQVLDEARHPFELKAQGKVIQSGSFFAGSFDRREYFKGFECRFVSYMLETDTDVAFYYSGSSIQVFVHCELWEQSQDLQDALVAMINFEVTPVTYIQVQSGNRRGRRGRSCGAWCPHSDSIDNREIFGRKYLIRLSSRQKKAKAQSFRQYFDKSLVSDIPEFQVGTSFFVNNEAATNNGVNVTFSLVSSGAASEMSRIDLIDLVASPELRFSTSQGSSRQVILFRDIDSKTVWTEGPYKSEGQRPLLNDIPEGARLLSVLASDRRKDNFIRFIDEAKKDEVEENLMEDNFIDICIPRTLSINGNKWKRNGVNGMVYVPVNSVPAAAVSKLGPAELFACCANTLELRGGAIRAEGITILPPGRLFLGLALLCFGLNPRTFLPISLNLFLDEEEKQDAYSMNDRLESFATSLIEEALSWICEKEKDLKNRKEWIVQRIRSAILFHESYLTREETLVCQPDKIASLLKIFDEVDGCSLKVWKGLGDNLPAPRERGNMPPAPQYSTESLEEHDTRK